ncbi:acyl-CoA reductase [Clostridium ihumii]|uniref:acyl-CoA reductase n=1 Tax=Clostridium ihumii TaxID=1470356 RepID=UPI003D33B39D
MNNNFKHVLFGNVLNESKDLDLDVFKEYLNEEILKEKLKKFNDVPIDDILIVLEKVGTLISDKNSIYFKKIMSSLPDLLLYSHSMVEEGLYILQDILKRENLSKRLSSLGNYHCLDTFVYEYNQKIKRAMPIGLLCHVAAGNVFLGAVDSLIYGIITKNINILKVSSQDFIFPSVFLDALMEADTNNIIYPYICLTYWNKENEKVTGYIKSICDAILLFGGEDSVINYKNGLSAKTKLYDFGPKLSYGLVCKNLSYEEILSAAEGFANDIVYWEQRACTSCQNIFIEEDENTDIFINALYSALENLSLKYPQPEIDLHSAIEIKSVRELNKWNEFNGKAKLIEGNNANHTLIIQNSHDIIPSPLNRTIYINKIKSYKDILHGNITNFKYYMSTTAIACDNNIQDIIEDFMNIGVMRFCKPGMMSSSDDPASPHDGMYLTNLLVKFINTENICIDSLGIDYLDTNKKDRILLSRLNNLLLTAKKSPFYSELYKDIELPLKSLNDFSKLPILEKKHLFENSIDKSSVMLTDVPNNAYTFSAGGTTGKMKYINYSNSEFREAKKVFGQGFRAAGINKNDYVANYMKSGALWTGYIAVNDGLEETGCKILSITSNQDEDETIEYLKLFKPNSIMSIPGNIILLAQRIEEKSLDITIENIYYSGDHLTEPAKEYLKKTLKAKKICSMGYAAVETGPIGFTCPHCDDREHHVCEDWCYLERSTDGDALVTVLGRTLHPIIRFRVGDKIDWIDEKCSCGRTSKKFRLLSRSDDIIRFNASDIHLKQLDTVISKFEPLSSFYQVTIEPLENMLKFNCNIELKDSSIKLDKSLLANKVKFELKNECIALNKDLKSNLIKELNVNILKPKEIKRVSRTNKLRRVVDKRISL